jgi:hypothetical protein
MNSERTGLLEIEQQLRRLSRRRPRAELEARLIADLRSQPPNVQHKFAEVWAAGSGRAHWTWMLLAAALAVAAAIAYSLGMMG